MSLKHWLMKAEPDTRIVKGKDVKFSVDDFESVKTTPWEGVRNAEARNLMKEMKQGDKVLFYHSNCKTPGIAAFAEVFKEAYPDYSAWDSSHPYYDSKTDKANPKWYMVDVSFVARSAHFVPLAFLRRIAAVPTGEPPSEVSYIGQDGVQAIKQMALVTRGRLSVQRVDEKTWGVIEQLAERGGWEETGERSAKSKQKSAVGARNATGRVPRRQAGKGAKEDGEEDSEDDKDKDDKDTDDAAAHNAAKSAGPKQLAGRGRDGSRKRKAEGMHDEKTGSGPVRRSTRVKK